MSSADAVVARAPARTCTALHADVSGFTRLADRLDPDELHEIIHPVIEALTATAEDHGGLLLKYGGDAVLVVFGVDDGAEDHADRALDTALAMHEELDALRRRLPAVGRELELHIGVASGPVPTGIEVGVAIDRVVAGGTIASAQEVEGAAPAGRTYVAASTVALAGGRFRYAAPDGPDAVAAGVVALVGGERSGAGPGGRQQEVRDLLRLLRDPSAPPTAFAEERRLVTAVFVGVSAGPSQERETEVVDRLVAVAERHGGHVSRYAGDALLVSFGAPVTHDDDAARALSTAMEMHAAVGRMGADLGLRIGINSGHVVSGRFGGHLRTDFSVLGDAINVAQRLQAAAPVGSTYVGEATVQLARDRIRFEPITGGLELKGKPHPVPAWRVVGHATPGAARDAAALVGRRTELAEALSVLDRTVAGQGSVLVVVGEAGVGKSRLAAEVEAEAARRGVTWLQARCLSYGSAIPYWPYAELLRRTYDLPLTSETRGSSARLLRGLTDDGVADTFPSFARLLGLDGSTGDAGVTGPAFRRGLHRAFERWFDAVAATRPTVLAIEDVHWMDASSTELTVALAGTTMGRRFTIITTARPEVARVVDDLRDSSVTVEDVELSSLDEPGVRELIGELLGGDPPHQLVRSVQRRASGNPFFVLELVGGLLDAGVLRSDGGRWELRPGWDERSLPTTVEGVLASRLDRLPPGASRTLSVAAVVGRHVRPTLLREVAGEVGLDADLDELVGRGFLEPGADGSDVLVFRHALIQDVAYSRLVRRRRLELHRAVADAAEALYGAGDEVIDLLARHRYLAGEGERALPYLLRAGRRARELFANDEAILHLSRAVELLRGSSPSDDATSALLLELAELSDLIGEYEHAFQLYDEVRRTTGSAAAWRGVAAVLRKRGQYEAAFQVVDEALGRPNLDARDAAALWLERGWSLSFTGRYAEAVEAFERGLTTLDDGDPRLAGRLLVQSVRPEIMLGRYEAALARARSAEAAFERAGDLLARPSAFRVLGDALWQLGRLTEAAEALRRGIQLADRVGSIEDLCSCLVNLGLVELERGDLDEAIACDRRAIEEYERIRHASGRATAHANLAEKLLLAGQLDEAELHVDRGLRLAHAIGFTAVEADALRTLARILLERGRREDARASAAAAALFDAIRQSAAADECLTLVRAAASAV